MYKRQIQTIGWVAKRHFGTDTLDELVAHGFLTRDELRKLKMGQSFLWKVRFGLHVLTCLLYTSRAGVRQSRRQIPDLDLAHQ